MDVVVTVPKTFGLDTWIAEGDPAGEAWSGKEWHFYLGGSPPQIKPGERVYVVCNGALRGYAPLIRIDRDGWCYGLVRHGGAVAVSIPEYIRGFRGYRYRWWDTAIEQPFPNWRDPEAALLDIVTDETTLRATAIPSIPPSGLDSAYELTQAIEKAEAAKQAPREVPLFGDPQWIQRTKPKAAPSRCIIEVNGKRI